MPFLALVADPTAAERISAFATIRAWLGIADPRQFALLVGLVALGIILLNSSLNAALTWAQLLFRNLVGFTLSRRLFRRYLARDRLFFAHRNSAELSKNILNEVAGAFPPEAGLKLGRKRDSEGLSVSSPR